MQPTIRDIAKVSGVSVCTVSNVLRRKGKVGELTRKKVMQIVRQLNYNPLRNIPQLDENKTRVIGLVMPFGAWANPFYSRAINAAKEETSRLGFNCMIFSQDDVKNKMEHSFHLGQRNFNCDGMVFFCPFNTSDWQGWARTLLGWDVPVVLVRRQLKAAGIAIIDNDEETGVRAALDHLYKCGHTTIGIMMTSPPPFPQNIATWRAFMREHGLADSDELIISVAPGLSDPDAAQAVQALRQKGLHPTAFLVRDDIAAYHVIRQLEAAGLRVPQDISIVGFDDDFSDDPSRLPLTTIRIPVEDMVRLACRTLAERFAGIKATSVVMELPLELIVRESTKVRSANCEVRTEDGK